MITLNDYLYNGDTVLKILYRYTEDLRKSALESHNQIDIMHCNFLLQLTDLLEHNDFLTSQSSRIREFYIYMTQKYPYLAFTYKGRIKSLIRAEEKFNAKIVEYVSDYYLKNGVFPTEAQVKPKLRFFRDLIAYRIVISMPRCHLEREEDREEVELKHLYEIANALPTFLEERGFSAELSGHEDEEVSDKLTEENAPYYRDYVKNKSPFGYQSLHITLYDNIARSYFEVQLRTKQMDDYAEIGPANHLGYEKRQEKEQNRIEKIPRGECIYFDEAYERLQLLHSIELKDLDVNMFTAYDNLLVNDGCGLYRGRQIRPYEHLSRFQNDILG